MDKLQIPISTMNFSKFVDLYRFPTLLREKLISQLENIDKKKKSIGEKIAG